MPDRVVHRTRVAEGLAVTAVAVALLTSFAAYTANNKNIDKIRDSRVALTLRACKEQNQRNVNTKKVLADIAKKAKEKNPERSAAIDASIEQTNFIIDALAPVRDCKAYVKARLS